MECLICGSEHIDVRRVDVDGVTLGLPGGRLIGVDRATCHDCGEVIDSLPAHGAVLKEYRIQLAHLARRLTGEEFAFLRRALGVNGSQYADMIGVSNVTISRVENGGDVTAVQDALIRSVTILDIHTPDGLMRFAGRERAEVMVDIPEVVLMQPRELTDGWQDINEGAHVRGNVVWLRRHSKVVARNRTSSSDVEVVSFESDSFPHAAACGGR